MLAVPLAVAGQAWRQLTRAIHCPACGQLQQPAEACRSEKCKEDMRGVRSPLHGLRFHDLRHHAITELAESQANDSIIREIAGHVSPKMLANYSHVRMETQRKVLDVLSDRGSTGGMAQTTTQIRQRNPLKTRNRLKKLVEPKGFEPSTSSMPSRRAPNCATAPQFEQNSLPL